MTYDAFETSAESGRPVELFEITLGSAVYRWTSAEDTQSFGGNDFTPIVIERNGFAEGSDDRDGILELLVSSSNAFAQEYIDIVPTDLATVEVLRLHRGDGNTVTIWRGKVQTVTFFDQNQRAKIACRPDLGTTSRLIPRRTFQVQCNHVLYGTACAVVEASFRYTGTVASVSADGRTLTVTGLSANGADWAVGGFVTFGADKRMILSQSTDDVVISLPFRSSPSGQSVDVQAGCDHTAATCESKFSNLENFGGFPFVPTRDIFRNGVT